MNLKCSTYNRKAKAMTQTNNVGGNVQDISGGAFGLFNQIPMPLIVGYYQLYTHFLDKGVGTQQAANQAWDALRESLPVIRTGMTNLGITVESLRGAA